MQDILKVNNLYVIYNKKTNNPFVAVKNFSYTFQTGKIYCIIGQSGSGKSSLINCFNGLNKPDYGSININNIKLSAKKRLDLVILDINESNKEIKINKNYKYKYELSVSNDAKYQDVFLAIKAFYRNDFYLKKINKNLYFLAIDLNKNEFILNKETNNINSCFLDKKAKRKIKNYMQIRKSVGIVYQFPEFQLFKPTVIDDVCFGLRNMKINKQESVKIAQQTLLNLGINESLFNNSPFNLSGGQKRKVALAGIFSINPSIYVFDEPTAGLDPVSNSEMLNYMIEFKKQNKCVIVVTHSMDDVLLVADEILVIHDGKLVQAGDPYDIFLNKDILKNSRIDLPLVIDCVLKLINKNKKYSKLLEYKPKTVEDLSNKIYQIIKE